MSPVFDCLSLLLHVHLWIFLSPLLNFLGSWVLNFASGACGLASVMVPSLAVVFVDGLPGNDMV